MRRAAVASLLLVSLLTGTISLAHQDDADDFACNPVLATHDESAHYIGPDSTPAAPDADHCFLCHSLRSFTPAFDRFEHSDQTTHTGHLYTAQIDRLDRVAWALVPGRAPPI